jgi:hypothetical protein
MAIAPQTSVSDTQGGPLEGQLDGFVRGDLRSYKNTDTAEIPFGCLVCLDASAEDTAAKLPTDATIPAGVVVFSHKYAKPQELGDTGLKTGTEMHVLRKGTIWVHVKEAVDPGDTVRVILDATDGQIGSFATTSQGTGDSAVIAEACWLTSTSGAGVALLEVDFTTQAALNDD